MLAAGAHCPPITPITPITAHQSHQSHCPPITPFTLPTTAHHSLPLYLNAAHQCPALHHWLAAHRTLPFSRIAFITAVRKMFQAGPRTVYIYLKVMLFRQMFQAALGRWQPNNTVPTSLSVGPQVAMDDAGVGQSMDAGVGHSMDTGHGMDGRTPTSAARHGLETRRNMEMQHQQHQQQQQQQQQHYEAAQPATSADVNDYNYRETKSDTMSQDVSYQRTSTHVPKTLYRCEKCFSVSLSGVAKWCR